MIKVMRAVAGLIAVLLVLLNPAMAADIELRVQSAEAGLDPFSFQPVVSVVLTPEASKTFGKLTTRNIGKVIEIWVDGELVSSPVVQTPILGGALVISGALSADEAGSLAERLADAAAVITLRLPER